MKKFILRRKRVYQETVEVESESGYAEMMLLFDSNDDIKISPCGDVFDEVVEYVGDVEHVGG